MFRQKYNIDLIENHFLVKMAYLETIHKQKPQMRRLIT